MVGKVVAAAIGGLALFGLWIHSTTGQDRAKESPYDRPYFYFDAESQRPGDPLPQPPFFPQPWKEPNAHHPKRGKIVADPTAPQGKNVIQWNVQVPKTTELYHEVPFDRRPEARISTSYYGFYVRYDRINGQDIWHTGTNESSADKGFEIKGDGIRWIVSFGSWGHSNEKQRFTTWVGNPTYHVNPRVEIYDAYYPNQSGYSQDRPIALKYEQWHALVFKMKWATDDTGEIGLWVDGEHILEYKNIKTVKAPGTWERLQFFGTIAQPAYDAPPHIRKVDAILFTDRWQDIVRGGYLKNTSP